MVVMSALKRAILRRAEIKRMRVSPEYQGHGYGQRLLEELEPRARTLGYHILHTDTSVLQIPAQRLYETNGVREVGRDVLQQEVGKDAYQPLEVILYEK